MAILKLRELLKLSYTLFCYSNVFFISLAQQKFNVLFQMYNLSFEINTILSNFQCTCSRVRQTNLCCFDWKIRNSDFPIKHEIQKQICLKWNIGKCEYPDFPIENTQLRHYGVDLDACTAPWALLVFIRRWSRLLKCRFMCHDCSLLLLAFQLLLLLFWSYKVLFPHLNAFKWGNNALYGQNKALFPHLNAFKKFFDKVYYVIIDVNVKLHWEAKIQKQCFFAR